MKSETSIIKLSRSQWISVAVLASSLGLAAAVTIPNVFTAGTTISASQVNANFNALNGALPLVWASTDQGAGGTVVAAGTTTINSVSINAPSAGNLLVSGSVFVNNEDVAGCYLLNLLIDGAVFSGHAFLADFCAAGNLATASVAELFTLSYSITVPITAGAHTIAQTLNGGALFYNKNNLTVLFLPSSQVTVTPAFAAARTAVPDEVGSNQTGQ